MEILQLDILIVDTTEQVMVRTSEDIGHMFLDLVLYLNGMRANLGYLTARADLVFLIHCQPIPHPCREVQSIVQQDVALVRALLFIKQLFLQLLVESWVSEH